jgi:DNA-binding ferritin-like protein
MSVQSEKYTAKKEKVAEKLGELMVEYEEFTKMVSPEDWRITGHHFTELRKMNEDIRALTEITPEQRKRAEELGLL